MTKFLSKYKHKTVFKSFWVTGILGVANKLQELNDIKNQRVDFWKIVCDNDSKYGVIVELHTWVKRKKKN